MDQSVMHAELALEQTINETDEGLVDQFFFYAAEQPKITNLVLPSKFIMRRMMRVE